MSVVTSVLTNIQTLDKGVALDTLPLTSAQRASPHFTARTTNGSAIRVSLPRGSELQDGDVLQVRDGVAVVVLAAAEDLLLLKPGADPMMWWVACYQLGNLHRPARFLDDGILTPYDPMALSVLAGYGTDIERVSRPFVGRRFGAVKSHHHHGGEHSHAHGHQEFGSAIGAGQSHTHDHGA